MDSQQQQFCLKWNSFGTNLATSFSNLFKSESLADVTLFCDGVTFKAHKLILAACSKHLADLFETAPLHQNLLVILDGTSASNMSALLEFMYKGEVHVSQDALSSFLKAAESLQVKGLSIEHEKLIHSQSSIDTSIDSPMSRKHLKLLKEEIDTGAASSSSNQQRQSSPSPTYSPALSPYMHHHYRAQYEARHPPGPLRSPGDLLQDRASVLRDGSKRPGSPGGPLSLAYRPSPPGHVHEADAPPPDGRDPDMATALISKETGAERCIDPGCPEDLRMKMETSSSTMHGQEEPASSTGSGGAVVTGGSANGSLASLPNYNHDRDPKDLLPSSLWNSVSASGKITGHKASGGTTINTPDGKKLKCPFCERLYGYETNLRAHIRQRHQGIRVPCPFCSRTFTRNNTVRRHIAREHKAEISLKAFQTQQQQQQQQQQGQVLNHNP